MFGGLIAFVKSGLNIADDDYASASFALSIVGSTRRSVAMLVFSMPWTQSGEPVVNRAANFLGACDAARNEGEVAVA